MEKDFDAWKVARANLSQIRVVDTRRLVERIGFLDKGIFSLSPPLREVRQKPTI